MRCSICSAPSRVLDSRPADDGRVVRRRRVCEARHERFTTYEQVDRAGTDVEASLRYVRSLASIAEEATLDSTVLSKKPIHREA